MAAVIADDKKRDKCDRAGDDAAAERARAKRGGEIHTAARTVAREIDGGDIGAVATVRTPMATELGLSQLATRSPFALPIGTRPKAIAPTTVPRANGEPTHSRSNSACPRRRPPPGLGHRTQVTGEEEIAGER